MPNAHNPAAETGCTCPPGSYGRTMGMHPRRCPARGPHPDCQVRGEHGYHTISGGKPSIFTPCYGLSLPPGTTATDG